MDHISEKKQQKILNLYNSYVKEICALKSIPRYSKKVTITASVLNPERTNEQKILDALKGEELQEGDKVFLFFKSDRSLCLEKKFDGDYDKKGLLEKLFKSALIFENIYPVREKLLNYSLKRSQEALKSLLEAPEPSKAVQPLTIPQNTPKRVLNGLPGFNTWSLDKAWKS